MITLFSPFATAAIRMLKLAAVQLPPPHLLQLDSQSPVTVSWTTLNFFKNELQMTLFLSPLDHFVFYCHKNLDIDIYYILRNFNPRVQGTLIFFSLESHNCTELMISDYVNIQH